MQKLNVAGSLVCLVASMALGGCAAPASAADPTAESAESAFTNDWRPTLTCNGGAAVLDVNESERRNVQFVIRDANVIRYLNEAGAYSSSYGANEIVLSGWTGRVNWSDSLGPRLDAQPYGGPGVFNAGDFHEMIANHDTYEGGFGSFVRVAREGAGIKVQFGTIEKRGCANSQSEYVGDGYGTVTSCIADYSAYVEKANWYFESCH